GPMENVFQALRRVVDRHADVHMVYPVHPSAYVQRTAAALLGGHPRIHLIPPVVYLDMIQLLKRAYLVVTDSGGLQEEAPALGKPVMVIRKVTERPEAVVAGTTQVIGVDEACVFRSVDRVLTDPYQYQRMAATVHPYGDGKAAWRTLAAIRYFFGMCSARPA